MFQAIINDVGPWHVDYPHEPGRLYDCALCESRCFCTGEVEDTPCVFCAGDRAMENDLSDT